MSEGEKRPDEACAAERQAVTREGRKPTKREAFLESRARTGQGVATDDLEETLLRAAQASEDYHARKGARPRSREELKAVLLAFLDGLSEELENTPPA